MSGAGFLRRFQRVSESLSSVAWGPTRLPKDIRMFRTNFRGLTGVFSGGLGGSQVRYSGSERNLGDFRWYFRKFQRIFSWFWRCYRRRFGGFKVQWGLGSEEVLGDFDDF